MMDSKDGGPDVVSESEFAAFKGLGGIFKLPLHKHWCHAYGEAEQGFWK